MSLLTKIFLAAYCVFTVCAALALIQHIKKCVDHKYTGVVTYKSADEVSIKHGSRTDLYLGFKTKGKPQIAVSVDVNTYITKSVGDTITFNLDQLDFRQRDETTGIILLIWFAITFAIAFSMLFVFLP